MTTFVVFTILTICIVLLFALTPTRAVPEAIFSLWVN